MPLSQTVISGTIYDVNGVAVSNVAVYVLKVLKSGVAIQFTKKLVATSDVNGAVSFSVPRDSNTWIQGNFYSGSTKFQVSGGVGRTIPDAPTATLESLGDPVALTALAQPLDTQLTAIAALSDSAGWLHNDGAGGMAWTTPASSGLVVGTSAITSGTTTRVLYDNAGVLGEYQITGTGKVAMDTSPTFVTPALGTPASGVLTNCTGTAAGLTAGNVTTNANLTGPITSSGNATAVASQTGTGSKFVMDTSPTLVTPVLGVASATSINKWGFTAPTTAATLVAGADNCTYTFPAATATIARTDAAQTFTGTQSFAGIQSSAGINIGANSATAPISKSLEVYNTDDGAGNYERGAFDWSANVLRIGTFVAGTGGNRNVNLYRAGFLQASLQGTSFRIEGGILDFATDNSQDIGASGANRPRNVFVGGYVLHGRNVVAKTGNYTVVAADKHTFFTNTGAAGAVNFTLPTAAAGLTFEFYIDAAQTLTVTAGASTTIRVGASVTAAAGNVSANTVGNRIRLVAISATQWVGDITGTWTFT